MLNAQAKTSPVVLFFLLLDLNIFLVASSVIVGTLELRGIGHFWSLQENPRGAVQVPPVLLTPLGAAPGTCGPWAGQEGQGDIYRWSGKSQVGFLDLFYCEGLIHSIFSTLNSSVASLSLAAIGRKDFLFCSLPLLSISDTGVSFCLLKVKEGRRNPGTVFC